MSSTSGNDSLRQRAAASRPASFSLQPPDLSSCTKTEIRKYFLNSYDLYEALFSSIQDDSTFFKQPDKLRLQLIFYLGHTSAVYVNKLVLSGSLKDRQPSTMDMLFETGVDEMVWDSTDQCRLGGDFNWPSVHEVRQYRHLVKETILQLIDDEPLELPLIHKDPWWALVMGIEHERIHLETSSVLLRQLPADLLKAPPGWHYAPPTTTEGGAPINNKFVAVGESNVSIGKPEEFPSFAWDNSYGHLDVTVPAFEAQQYLTTNREFLDFVKDSGYNNRRYWSDEGWKWRCSRKACHPTFWICTKGCKSGCEGDLECYSHCSQAAGAVEGLFRYRAMFDVIAMPWDWPAETNYHEAHAYCAWLGSDCRLMTEAEFIAIRDAERVPTTETEFDVIFRRNVAEQFNLNIAYSSSTPVDFYPKSSSGFHDTMGNVWQWTEDHFNGLPGAKFDYLYHDFSAPYYDGWHNSILGGSWISTGDSASSFYRGWFRRHFFQHMGFRVVRSANKPPVRLLSTQVYQPQKGFIDTEHQLSSFPNVLKVKSPTPEFALESDENIRLQLQWDFGHNTLPKKTLIDAINGYQTEQITSPTGKPKDGNLTAVTSFWADVSGVLANATSHIQRCEHRALVIGSGTGRMAMQAAKHYSNVLGIHPVSRSVEISELLQQGKMLTGPAVDNVPLDGLVLPQKQFPSILFKQFLWVPLEMGQFDLVILALLDVTSCPEYWLARLANVVSKSGVAMIVSSTWNPTRLSPVLAKYDMSMVESQQLQHNQPRLSLDNKEKTSVCASLWMRTSAQSSRQ